MPDKFTKASVWIFCVLISGLSFSLLSYLQSYSVDSAALGSEDSESTLDQVNKSWIARKIGPYIQANQFPQNIDIKAKGDNKTTTIRYTLDLEAQDLMTRLLTRYKPDYGAFIAMDANTGRIISMVSYSEKLSHENLNLRATFPAASIFKVVTAAAAIDLDLADADTVIPYNGANHTLYKRNVLSTAVNKWTRKISLRDAFAKSVNTYFGKLGLNYIGAAELRRYAERFHFNTPIQADFPIQEGTSFIDEEDPWSVVEAASGFTRDANMSPVQGAMIAAAVANDGIIMEPYLVEEIISPTGEVVFNGAPKTAATAVEPGTAEALRDLFQRTITSGTSRRSFRQTLRRRGLRDVEFGGKTGSLTGLDPEGKCDWFVGYALVGDHRIAVAALTVNEEYWRVKSSTLASLFFEKYIPRLIAESSQVADSK